MGHVIFKKKEQKEIGRAAEEDEEGRMKRDLGRGFLAAKVTRPNMMRLANRWVRDPRRISRRGRAHRTR